jgi:hypothetical protein
MKSDRTVSANTRHGFTRLDLVVILATLVLFAAIILPALGNSSPSRSLVCMDNLRRLQAAWFLYAEDRQGKLPGNYHGALVPTSDRERPWATGWLDWADRQDNTNVVYLTDSRYACLSEFLTQDATLYKCPADDFVSLSQLRRGWTARVRSYAMNCYLGEGNQETGPLGGNFPIILRLDEFKSLPPGRTFVFTEEHPDSINDPLLFVNMSSDWLWIDLPGSFHDGASWFTFADGHLESRVWQSASTVRPVRFTYANNTPAQPDDPDLIWLRARASAK